MKGYQQGDHMGPILATPRIPQVSRTATLIILKLLIVI